MKLIPHLVNLVSPQLENKQLKLGSIILAGGDIFETFESLRFPCLILAISLLRMNFLKLTLRVRARQGVSLKHETCAPH